jgi:hypothetical protein
MNTARIIQTLAGALALVAVAVLATVAALWLAGGLGL